MNIDTESENQDGAGVGGEVSGETPKAITFDATGTLLRIRGGVGDQYAQVARDFGLEVAPGSLGKAFGKIWMTLSRPPRDGEPSPDDDKGWWRELVQAVAGETGLNLPDFDAFFETLYARFATTAAWEVYPEVPEVLQALHGKHKLAVISDFDGRLRAVLRSFGLDQFFECVLISSEVGADKPDPQIFHLACEKLGVARESVWHVGDDPKRDWAGARAAGMQAFELDRERNSLRDLLTKLRFPG